MRVTREVKGGGGEVVGARARTQGGDPAIARDDERLTPSACMTFVVRVLRDDADGESVIVEFVRTGEKQRVYAMAAIGTAIAEMAARRRDLAGQRASESNIRRAD